MDKVSQEVASNTTDGPVRWDARQSLVIATLALRISVLEKVLLDKKIITEAEVIKETEVLGELSKVARYLINRDSLRVKSKI